METFDRLMPLIGEEGLKMLSNSKVIIFGLGGVGGYVVEAFARSGVGSLVLVDDDVVKESNINRQLIALHSTIGKSKALLWEERVKDINPSCEVKGINQRYTNENRALFDLGSFDLVIDAIDSVKDKTDLIIYAEECGTRIISSMGTGGKKDISFKVGKIEKTEGDSLARVMRKNLKGKGTDFLTVVYSTEASNITVEENGKRVPSSIIFSPSVAGLTIAREGIQALLGEKWK